MGFGMSLEQRFAVMVDTAGFAMHQLMRADNVPAKSRADRLVSQAHAQDRPLPGKVLDQVNADARLLRRAGSGRNQDVAGTHPLDFLRRDLVIAADLHLLSQLAQILDQVVSEGIVIVEDEYHARTSTTSLTEVGIAGLPKLPQQCRNGNATLGELYRFALLCECLAIPAIFGNFSLW